MLSWIAANTGTIAVCVLVLGAVTLAVRSLVRGRGQGGSCSCGCSGCVMGGSCRKGTQTQDENK